MACIYNNINGIPLRKSSPYEYPGAFTDVAGSKYPQEVTGPITNRIYSTTRDELLEQYPTESQYPYPPLLITVDPNHTRHNTGIYEYQLAHGMLTYNNDPACTEPFAVRNLNSAGSLQAGYAKNIDLDSELRRINHLTDKCFYDNFKAHPFEAPAGNGLYCNKNVLVPDYSAIGKPTCLPRQTQLSAITPIAEQRMTTSSDDLYQSDNRVEFGQFKNPSSPNENMGGCVGQVVKAPKCLDGWQGFSKCTDNIPDNAQCLINYKMSIAGNMPSHYQFNGDIYQPDKKLDSGFPCQRLFNNSTKRSTLPNFQNTFDINPKFL